MEGHSNANFSDKILMSLLNFFFFFMQQLGRGLLESSNVKLDQMGVCTIIKCSYFIKVILLKFSKIKSQIMYDYCILLCQIFKLVDI